MPPEAAVPPYLSRLGDTAAREASMTPAAEKGQESERMGKREKMGGTLTYRDKEVGTCGHVTCLAVTLHLDEGVGQSLRSHVTGLAVGEWNAWCHVTGVT